MTRLAKTVLQNRMYRLDAVLLNARAKKPDPVADDTAAAVARGYLGSPVLPHQHEAMLTAARIIRQAPTTVSGNHPGWPEVTGDWHVYPGPASPVSPRIGTTERRLRLALEPLGHSVDVVRRNPVGSGYSIYVRANKLPFTLKPETLAHSEYPAVHKAVVSGHMPAKIAADWFQDQGEDTAAARLRAERHEWVPGIVAKWKPKPLPPG